MMRVWGEGGCSSLSKKKKNYIKAYYCPPWGHSRVFPVSFFAGSGGMFGSGVAGCLQELD